MIFVIGNKFYKICCAEICSTGWARVLLHCKHTGWSNLLFISILIFYLFVWINNNQIIYCDQVPGSTTYNLALYYMMNTPVANAPLLEGFINGDDAYRNSRFKLIPYISKVSTWNVCCSPLELETTKSESIRVVVLYLSFFHSIIHKCEWALCLTRITWTRHCVFLIGVSSHIHVCLWNSFLFVINLSPHLPPFSFIFIFLITLGTFLKRSPLDSSLDNKTYGQLTPPTKISC